MATRMWRAWRESGGLRKRTFASFAGLLWESLGQLFASRLGMGGVGPVCDHAIVVVSGGVLPARTPVVAGDFEFLFSLKLINAIVDGARLHGFGGLGIGLDDCGHAFAGI